MRLASQLHTCQSLAGALRDMGLQSWLLLLPAHCVHVDSVSLEKPVLWLRPPHLLLRHTVAPSAGAVLCERAIHMCQPNGLYL